MEKYVNNKEGSPGTKRPEQPTYPGFSWVIQKSAGSPGWDPNPMYSSWRPMNWYPRGCRQERKNDVEAGRLETVKVMCDTGMMVDRAELFT